MVDPDFIDVTVMKNDDGTVGAIILSDNKKIGYEGTKVQTEYLRDVLEIAESMDWDSLWIGVSGDGELVLFEPTGDHGPGTIAVAPILPPDGDGDE